MYLFPIMEKSLFFILQWPVADIDAMDSLSLSFIQILLDDILF